MAEDKKAKKNYILRQGFGIQTDDKTNYFAESEPKPVQLTEKEYAENLHKLEDPAPKKNKE